MEYGEMVEYHFKKPLTEEQGNTLFIAIGYHKNSSVLCDKKGRVIGFRCRERVIDRIKNSLAGYDLDI